MKINEKETKLIEFCKLLNIKLESKGEKSEFKDKNGLVINRPRVLEISYKVRILDD